MKPLLILLVLLLAIWLWRSGRGTVAPRKQSPADSGGAPQDMICCSLCSLHVPAADAVQGQHGRYCGLDHLHRAEP